MTSYVYASKDTTMNSPCDECVVRAACSTLCDKAMAYEPNKYSMAVLRRQLDRLNDGRKGNADEWVQLGKDLDKYRKRGNK